MGEIADKISVALRFFRDDGRGKLKHYISMKQCESKTNVTPENCGACGTIYQVPLPNNSAMMAGVI